MKGNDNNNNSGNDNEDNTRKTKTAGATPTTPSTKKKSIQVKKEDELAFMLGFESPAVKSTGGLHSCLVFMSPHTCTCINTYTYLCILIHTYTYS